MGEEYAVDFHPKYCEHAVGGLCFFLTSPLMDTVVYRCWLFRDEDGMTPIELDFENNPLRCEKCLGHEVKITLETKSE